MGRRHGSLDDKAANVLPALLEEGDEVVDGKHQVGNDSLLLHVDVADSNTKTEDLLQLELDGGADVGDLGGHVLSVRDGGRELSGLGQTGTEQTGNLLDQSLGSKEGIVLASELLDELLVLVELLEILNGHGIEAVDLGTVEIVLVTKNTRNTSVSLGVLHVEHMGQMRGIFSGEHTRQPSWGGGRWAA